MVESVKKKSLKSGVLKQAVKHYTGSRGVKRGERGGIYPSAESLWEAESLRGAPKSPTNVASTFFNSIYAFERPSGWNIVPPKLIIAPGAI